MTDAPDVCGVNEVVVDSTGTTGNVVVVNGSSVVLVGVVGAVELSSSLRMFLRIKNPTTTAAMAMTIANVEPIGEEPLPDRFGGRLLGCSLLMFAPS